MYSSFIGYGALNYGQQDGFEVYNCTFDQTARGGYGIKFYEEGFSKNIKIHDNVITGAARNQSSFNFGIENWNDITNNEYYNNVIHGGFDFTHTLNSATGYTAYIHDNVIGWDAVPNHTEAGLTLEGVVYDVFVEKNHFMNLTSCVSMQFILPNAENPFNSYMENIHIRENIMEVGIVLGGWSYGAVSGIGFSEDDNTNTAKRIYIDNNTIICKGKGTRTDIYALAGIHYTCRASTQGLKIRNNIFQGFDGGYSRNGFFLGEATTSLDSLTFDNNLVYLCANSNAPTFYAGFTSGTHYDDDADNIKGLNPLFVTNADYRLTEDSPAAGTGLYIGALTDFIGTAYFNPPSIGAYEYAYPIPPPIITDYPRVFISTPDGQKFMRYGNKLIIIE